MKEKIPDLKARVFVDSAPILEKEWARRAGLGWIGRNTCLIRPGAGSWFFLAEILTDLELEPDPMEERMLCGSCTRCIDACPTKALNPEGYLDATKCISYLTIELKDSIPEDFTKLTDYWLFGCDICQEVCPWNRFSTETNIQEFKPLDLFYDDNVHGIKQMSQESFDKKFAGNPLKRADLEKLKRTITFLSPDD